MALNINGTTGISGVDGSVSAPALTGTDSNTGITFPSADTIKFSTGGVERMSITNSGVTGVAGGKILQVKTNTTRDSTGSFQCTPTQTYVDIPDQNVTITPSSASNKILISFSQVGETNYNTNNYALGIKRAISGGATTIIQGAAAGNRNQMLTTFTRSHGTDNVSTIDAAHCSGYLDSPNTTSAITYTVQIKDVDATNYYYYNRTANDDDVSNRERGLSWITVMEVAA